MFTVDEDRCDLCGLCAVACPAGLVDVSRGTPVPVPANGEEGECFVCGHCVAACPTGAFSHEKAPIHQCLPIRDDLSVSAEQVGQLLRSRRSVRHFTAEPVDRQTIAELLDIARYAPSGCNAQPVHWLVIYDTDRVRHISRLVVDGLRRIVSENSDSPLAAILQRLLDAWDEGADVVSRAHRTWSWLTPRRRIPWPLRPARLRRRTWRSRPVRSAWAHAGWAWWT